MPKRLIPFGVRCRAYRRRAGLVMADQAIEFGRSVAQTSAIERGTQPIPPNYPEKVALWLGLSDDETTDLQLVAKLTASRTEMVPADMALGGEFALHNSSAEQLRLLRATLSDKSTPSRHSFESLERWAQLARMCFNVSNKLTFDLVEILENKVAQLDHNYCLGVEPTGMMGDKLAGYTEIEGEGVQEIVLSEHAYDTAYKQIDEGRFVLAHELGHWLLHPTVFGQQRRTFKRNNRWLQYNRIEQEADYFAFGLLMPQEVISRYDTPEQVAWHCNVPLKYARTWMKHLSRWRPPDEQKRVNKKFSDLLGQLTGKISPPITDSSVPAFEDDNVPAEKTRIIPFPTPATNDNAKLIKHRKRQAKERDLPLLDYLALVQKAAESPRNEDHLQMLTALAVYSGHSKNETFDFAQELRASASSHSCLVDRNSEWFKRFGWRG